MRTLLLLAAFLLFVAPMATADDAKTETKPETITVEGEILDLGCYASREARGPDHQSCAMRCLSRGNPAGLITDDGQLYTLAASAPAFEPYAAMRVRIVGTPRAHLLIASTMQVQVDGEWQDVAMTKFGAPEKIEG